MEDWTMWADIEDSNVRTVWNCASCDKLTYCAPSIGTPGVPLFCSCGNDLLYVRTEVHIIGKRDETIL